MPNNNKFSMLLASTGHDIKNILGTAMESISWLHEHLQDLTPEQDQEFKQVTEMLSMVNNALMQILCLYKFENKQYTPQKAEHNVEEFLQFQLSALAPLAAAKKLTLTLSCEAQEYIFDEIMLSSAIRNALLNSLRFAKTTILLIAKAEETGLLLGINDDGPGYPSTMLGPLATEHQSGVDFDAGSTGLGLHFAQEVVLLHKTPKATGAVILENGGPLGGAYFQIHLPSL